MKKFLIFLACIMILVAASLYHSGLGGVGKGALTLYDGENIIYKGEPFLNDNKGVQRLDLEGVTDAAVVLRAYDATELWREEFDDGLSVVYAFSPMMAESVDISGRAVNLMIALRGNKAAIGMPILKGSY